MFYTRTIDDLDLSGLWRAARLDPELNRTGADADLDDAGWALLDVPGHWAQHPDFADYHGPVIYRRRFSFEHADPGAELAAGTGRRHWLQLDGVLSSAEIWLDGTYIGDVDDYFARHRFDITEQLSAEADHLLAIEVSCPNQGESRNKTSMTGTLQSGPMVPASSSPGGIWQPVSVRTTGPVSIRHSRLLCTAATTDRAELTVRLVLDADERAEIRIDTSIVGPDGSAVGGGAEHHTLASGENRIEWSTTVDNPQLWWPAALRAEPLTAEASSPLYEVAVAVREKGGQLSDRQEWRTGLRHIAIDNHRWRVNGHRLFVKGIAVGPPGQFLNQVSGESFRNDVRAAREAGLDMIRVFGHISRPELYSEADRLGMLIWQDLPLIGGYSSKVRSRARSLARAAVDHLGHHPSVALWGAHIEPNGQAVPAPMPTTAGARRTTGHEHGSTTDQDRPSSTSDLAKLVGPARLSTARQTGRHLLPTWNRLILDPIVGRELRSADSTRPTLTRSASLPSPADPTGSDVHLWLGWHAGRPDDLSEILRRWPRLASFLGGIGSQSVTIDSWDGNEPRWPTAEIGAFNRYIPRKAYGDGRSWAAATRAYQADLIRAQIETIRRLKYRPAGGFCVFSLFDAEPSGGFGVLDFDRQPKPALNTLIDACRPVVVIADKPPELVVPGQRLSLAIHVVSDLAEALGSVKVRAHARSNGWNKRKVWEGELGPDACVKVGDFEFEAPASPGVIEIDLELESIESLATNRYQTVVIPSAEALRRPTAKPGN